MATTEEYDHDTAIEAIKSKVVEEHQSTLDAVNIDVESASKDELNEAKAARLRYRWQHGPVR